MKRVALGIVFACALFGCSSTNSKEDETLLDDDSGTGTADSTSGDGTSGNDTDPEFDLGTPESGGDDTGSTEDTEGSGDAVLVFDAPGDTNCASSEVVAAKPPVDIIFAIDQSTSMSVEIGLVKNNINKLSAYLTATGLDYRVVMIADKTPSAGASYAVCVPQPLGGPSCTSSALLRVVDQQVLSTDALDLFLSTYDRLPPTPNSWQDFLRKDALKVFVPVTDDDSRAATGNIQAPAFDTALLAKPGGHFGTAARRNYKFYPIAGANKYPDEAKCSSAVNASFQHIALAKLTGGKWWPVCDSNYEPIFTEMAKDIASAVACEVAVPPAPAGQTFDPNKVNVIYSPSSGGSIDIVKDDANPCASANGWQLSTDGTKILLCGTACTGLKADPGGKVSVQFGCAGMGPPPKPDAGACIGLGEACTAGGCCAPLECLPSASGGNICRVKGPS